MEDQDPDSAEGTDFLLADEAASVGGHPAWQDILNAVPEQYHEALRPTLEKWDKGVQNRFQSLHSKYEPLKQYADYTPEDLEVAINLKQAIEADPKAVYDLLAQTYNFLEQGATDGESVMEIPEDFDGDPQVYQQLQMTQQQLADQQATIAALQQQQELERAEEELDAYMKYLHDEHGDFDDDYVVTLLANGVDGDEAVNRYNAIVAKAGGTTSTETAPAPKTAPAVMSAGGGVPSRAIDPKSLSNSDTKDLVAQMLLQAAQGE